MTQVHAKLSKRKSKYTSLVRRGHEGRRRGGFREQGLDGCLKSSQAGVCCEARARPTPSQGSLWEPDSARETQQHLWDPPAHTPFLSGLWLPPQIILEPPSPKPSLQGATALGELSGSRSSGRIRAGGTLPNPQGCKHAEFPETAFRDEHENPGKCANILAPRGCGGSTLRARLQLGWAFTISPQHSGAPKPLKCRENDDGRPRAPELRGHFWKPTESSRTWATNCSLAPLLVSRGRQVSFPEPAKGSGRRPLPGPLCPLNLSAGREMQGGQGSQGTTSC